MATVSKSISHNFVTKCIVILMTSFPFVVFGQIEICNNGIDDDFDNLIDLNDEDCYCEIVEPVSLIPNPSFEEMECCPNDRSQLDCASNWIQASEPTTDYIHICDYLGWDDFPPPMPFPDGQGIMGFRDGRVRGNDEPEPNWKEYAGACLTHPLLKDSSYRFQFDVGFVDRLKSPPIDISFFGTPSCEYLPFGVGNENFGCPSFSPHWKKLAEVNVSGGSGNTWVNTFIELIPEEDIYAIAIGPDCPKVNSPISIYYFFDNLILADLEFFNFQISEINHPCQNDFKLSVPSNSQFEYQWYLSGIALEGETSPRLTQNYGEGDYQVRLTDDATCSLSAKFEYRIPVLEVEKDVNICDGDTLEFGDKLLSRTGFYLDTFTTRNNCDSIVALDLNVIGQEYDTIEASILNGETYRNEDYSFKEEGNYELVLTSSLGCDRLVYLKLKVFNIYMPNCFSPNADYANDIFRPFVEEEQVASIDMKIFDRWGNLIYQGASWNGTGMDSGVYVYYIEFKFVNGDTKTIDGHVTLVR